MHVERASMEIQWVLWKASVQAVARLVWATQLEYWGQESRSSLGFGTWLLCHVTPCGKVTWPSHLGCCDLSRNSDSSSSK